MRRTGVLLAGAHATGWGLLLVALGLAAWLGGHALFDESAVSLHGDMPRHLMNGVFVYDFLSAPRFTWDGVLEFAEHYYARYPALSIGHHPPLLAVVLVPFYAVFGVSVAAARLASVALFITAVWLQFTLARRLYDARVAGWAALLLAVHAFMVANAQTVLTELLTIVMVLAAWNALLRFRDTGTLRSYLLFVVLAVAGLSAKQLAAFVWPAYVVVLLVDCRRQLMNRRVLMWTGAGAALALPVVIATLVLSPYNVSVVLDALNRSLGIEAWPQIVAEIRHYHLYDSLIPPLLLALAVGAWTRDRRIVFGIAWAVSVVLCMVLLTGPHDVPRYGIYAVPAYCLLVASIAAHATPGWRRVATTGLLVFLVSALLPKALAERPVGASGYEAAARVVTADARAPTVLYSASVDTGYFVFFVRKHDPARHLVVLRSDKVLTTSFMGSLDMEDRISNPADIYPVLQRYGTKYVVIEDRPTGSRTLDWLQAEVKGPRFVERHRFQTGSTDRRLRWVDVVVYEFLDATASEPDAELDLNLPIVGRELRVKLSDLIAPPARPR